MGNTPSFPKDTSPNAIQRAQQVSGMSLQQAKASLLQAKASLDSNANLASILLPAWWTDILARNNVSPLDPLLNIHGVITGSVNDAVKQYDKNPIRLGVDHALAQARKTGGWRMAAELKAVLLALFLRLEEKSPRPLPEIPARVLEVIPLEIARRINRMAHYTAMNISQFANVPPPKLKTQFENAVWAADLDPSRAEGLGKQMSFAKIIGKCDVNKLIAIREQVDSGRGAVCTSFAGATASILMLGNEGGAYRVELISGPNHCFCLVNRARSEKDSPDSSGATLMPGATFWGDGVILVDAWAGALGHPVFYASPKDFPQVLQVYLSMKLLQHFDSAS